MNAYDCKCIDGSIHGCSICRGYCSFYEHRGYLTDKLMRQHKCIEKGCYYFTPKASRERTKKNLDKSKELVRTAQATVAGMDGLKVMRAEQGVDGNWTVYYIAIAGYILEEAERIMSERLGTQVRFSQLPYSFDNAVKILMQ